MTVKVLISFPQTCNESSKFKSTDLKSKSSKTKPSPSATDLFH